MTVGLIEKCALFSRRVSLGAHTRARAIKFRILRMLPRSMVRMIDRFTLRPPNRYHCPIARYPDGETPLLLLWAWKMVSFSPSLVLRSLGLNFAPPSLVFPRLVRHLITHPQPVHKMNEVNFDGLCFSLDSLYHPDTTNFLDDFNSLLHSWMEFDYLLLTRLAQKACSEQHETLNGAIVRFILSQPPSPDVEKARLSICLVILSDLKHPCMRDASVFHTNDLYNWICLGYTSKLRYLVDLIQSLPSHHHHLAEHVRQIQPLMLSAFRSLPPDFQDHERYWVDWMEAFVRRQGLGGIVAPRLDAASKGEVPLL